MAIFTEIRNVRLVDFLQRVETSGIDSYFPIEAHNLLGYLGFPCDPECAVEADREAARQKALAWRRKLIAKRHPGV